MSDILQISVDTVDSILRGIHECQVGIATLRTELSEYKDRIDSDIKDLRGKHREASQSMADIQAAETADLKSSRDRWRNWVIGTASALFVAGLGAIIGHALK